MWGLGRWLEVWWAPPRSRRAVDCMVSMNLLFLWQILHSVADKLFYEETFSSDRSRFQKKVVSVKETCFCDINFFVKEIGFSFCVTLMCFTDKNTLFLEFITWFSGRGFREKWDNIYNNFVEPSCLPAPLFHTIWEKFCLLPPVTCQVSHVTRIRNFF